MAAVVVRGDCLLLRAAAAVHRHGAHAPQDCKFDSQCLMAKLFLAFYAKLTQRWQTSTIAAPNQTE